MDAHWLSKCQEGGCASRNWGGNCVEKLVTNVRMIKRGNEPCLELSFNLRQTAAFGATVLIKMIETKSDVIRELFLLKKITVQRRKIKGIVWYSNKNGYKVVNQYIEVLTLEK